MASGVSRNLPTATNVERMDLAILEQFWPEFYARNMPVVVTGGMEDWPAVGKWNPRFFAEILHGMEYPLRETDDEGEYAFVNHRKRIMGVSDYLDALEYEQLAGSRRPYFGNIPIQSPGIAQWFVSIRDDYQFPDVAHERVGDEVRLWIGGKGQKSTIHNDSNHGFNAQIYGRKTFLLYPPEQHPMLYAVRISDETWVSPVDWEFPDLNMHPEFAKSRAMAVELEVGEMLYIPAFWWHAARAESVVINLNIWIFTPDIGKWIQ